MIKEPILAAVYMREQREEGLAFSLCSYFSHVHILKSYFEKGQLH